jgi:phosphoribosyl 1,2-cyclic phosphate phosphodiesterase
LIEHGNTRLLVDTSPDLRQQALANKFHTVDAIFYTHAHADHTHGIDDIRSFNHYGDRSIPAYGSEETFSELKRRFPYVFLPPILGKGWFRPSLIPHHVKGGQRLEIGDITLEIFEQSHGTSKTFGIRIGGIAYSIDTNGLSDAVLTALEGIDVWIVDCLRYEPAPTHAHLDMALGWIKQVKPKRAILSHMGHEIDYDVLTATLPQGIEPGFDGMVIRV